MTVAVKDDSQFHLLFTSLPLDEKLIEEYTCSYNEGAAVSIGKLYISQQHVSYASKIGSTHIILPIKEISSITKKNSVYLFPNAIEIINFKDHKYFFSAFLSRDLAFATLSTIINAGGGTRTKIFEDALLEQQAQAAERLQQNSAIKNSSDEVEHPLSAANTENPFQETPTFSTFKTNSSNGIDIVNNSNGNNSSGGGGNADGANNGNIIDDTNSNSSDSSRFLKTSPSPSPSPTNKMLGSRMERKDSFESTTANSNSNNSSETLNNSGGTAFSTANLDSTKRNSGSQLDILSNHRQSSGEIPNDTLVGEDSNNGEDSSTITSATTSSTSTSSTFVPVLAKQDSLTNINNNNNNNTSASSIATNNNNNAVAPQSPLKSSQTINPSPPSPVQRRTGNLSNHNNNHNHNAHNNHSHNNHQNNNNNGGQNTLVFSRDNRSPQNVSPTNIAKENHEKPLPNAPSTTTTNNNESSSAASTAAAVTTPITTPITAASTASSTSQTTINTSAAAPTVTEGFSADSPKLSSVSAFDRLPVADKCDHISIAEFDEAPWSTEKYQISISEFYELICRTDFWGSVNTTHSYTEQSLSEWKQTNNCCIHRNIDFRTAIAFKIGPKSTRVLQTQRCKLKNKSEFIMQSTSISKDVPYGDSFSVENLLVVQAIDSTSCLTKLSSKIKFTKSVWGISSMIQKSALQGNKEFFILWNTMVRNQIETYIYNKMKELKDKKNNIVQQPTLITSASTGSLPIMNRQQQQQQQQLQPQQPQQPQQQQQRQVQQQIQQPSSVSTATVTTTTTLNNSTPISTPIVSVAVQPPPSIIQNSVQSSSPSYDNQSSTANGNSNHGQSIFNSNESISSTIYKKMTTMEKGILGGIVILFLSLLLCLTIGIISNSNSSRSLNNQIYRFSDSLILLDSRINSLVEHTPVDDGKVTYTSNIGKDKIQSIRDRLDLANSLLMRAQSMVSTLQAELSMEDLKLHKSEYGNNNFGNEGGSSLFGPLFFTILIASVSIIFYKFYK